MARPQQLKHTAPGDVDTATDASPRERNLGLALRMVAASPQPLSRADLAQRLGVTRATASALVEALVAGGLLVETGAMARSGRGRPGLGLGVSTNGPAGLGLEVNVDYLAVAVMDLSGEVRHREVSPADQRGRTVDDVLGDVGHLAETALTTASTLGLRAIATMVALPGLVSRHDGWLQVAPNLGWRDVAVAQRLATEPALSGVAVSVDNEANLSALAELATGASGSTFLHVSGEVGVGAGLVVDGELLRGRRGWSGELGHVPVDPRGPRCSCGARGCLETYAGLEAIISHAGLADEVGRSQATPASDYLAELARGGDRSLLDALDRAAWALACALQGALNLLDLDVVVLGGVYRDLAPWLVGPVEERLSARVLGARWSPPQVKAAATGAEAAVVGAAGAALRAVLDQPGLFLTRRRS